MIVKPLVWLLRWNSVSYRQNSLQPALLSIQTHPQRHPTEKGEEAISLSQFAFYYPSVKDIYLSIILKKAQQAR